VALLGPDDALPVPARRVLVAGSSGAGKTTLAAVVGAALGLPHVELDALFHGPGWVPRPSFRSDVERFAATDQWVTEWQYDAARDLLASRADLLVWLDLPRRLVVRQIVRRTVVRRLRGQELWNGNLEPPLRTVFTDPEHVVRWAWATHGSTAPRVRALHERRPELVVVRLRSRREVDRWRRGPLVRASRSA
jgi:adenylate kinase family enzyme